VKPVAVAVQRFARLATDVVTRHPAAWRLFRGPLRATFDRLAPRWDAMRTPDALAPLQAGLDALPGRPRRVLDLGTGTGGAAVAAAERFPDAEVVGVDLSPAMVGAARARLPAELAARVRFATADAAALPFPPASFDLVTLANMIPFWDELARVVAPCGTVAIAFSAGAATPIYVAPARIRDELGRRGFGGFRELAAGRGAVVLATRAGAR
jgi:SAM-dependent methyltransferase